MVGSHTSNCFCILCGALRNFRHLGYPGGCLDCRARRKFYRDDGIQICGHYDACTEEFLAWQTNRNAELCKLVPEFPLSSLPVWDDVGQLRVECLKRCVGPLAGFRSQKISKTSGKGKMTAQELSVWIMRATRDDATLSNSEFTGVMFYKIRVVQASLTTRNVQFAKRTNPRTLRQLRGILQLEQEYSRMTMHMKDERFSPSQASMRSIAVKRLILCLLHPPMRTHEKVLSLLLQHACQNRLLSKQTAQKKHTFTGRDGDHCTVTW